MSRHNRKLPLSRVFPSPSTSWSADSQISSSSQNSSSLPSFSSPSSRSSSVPPSVVLESPRPSQNNLEDRPSTPVFELDEEILADEFIMAIAWKKKRLGAAYYNTGSYEMFVIPDIPEDSADHGILKCVFFHVKPNTLVVSSRQESGRKKALKRLVGISRSNAEDPDDFIELGNNADSNSDDDIPEEEFNLEIGDKQASTRCHLQFVPQSFFGEAAARRRLMALRLPQESTTATDNEHYAYLRSVIPMDSVAAVQATGALLRFMEQWRKTNKSLLWEGFGPCSILSMTTQTLDSLLWMDESTFSSLQIFSKESHPSAAKRGLGCKEGLSLFGIFNRCKSSAGTNELRLMFMRPTRDLHILRERHSVMEFCIKPQHSPYVAALLNCLRKIKPVTTAVVKIAELRGKPVDWKRLLQTLTHIALLGEMCEDLPQDIALFNSIAVCAKAANVAEVAQFITKTINFEEWESECRFTVHPGIDDELDELKRRLGAITASLEQIASLEVNKLPARFKSGKFSFFPEIGFLLGLPRSDVLPGHGYERSLEAYGLVYQCDKAGYAYFQTWRSNEANEVYGKVMPEIVRREIDHLINASTYVVKNFQPLNKFLQLTGQLDALIAMANAIGTHRLTCPVFVDGEVGVEIEEGRHFLHEMVSSNYIPNETILGLDGYPRIFFITGPNASGKSNYLKQIALMVFMAHVGCYVPAKSMRLSTCDRIFAITQTVESCAVPLSHFAIQLTLMTNTLRSATRNSLVILDEFGKGTRDLDGKALLTACVRHWSRQDKDCPMLLISSHFHDVGESLKSQAGQKIFFGYMDYILDEELVFLYQLVPGTSGASLPLQVARATGVREEIVSRAQKVLDAVQHSRQVEPLESLVTDELYPGLKITLDHFTNFHSQDCDDILGFLLTKVVVNRRSRR